MVSKSSPVVMTVGEATVPRDLRELSEYPTASAAELENCKALVKNRAHSPSVTFQIPSVFVAGQKSPVLPATVKSEIVGPVLVPALTKI